MGRFRRPLRSAKGSLLNLSCVGSTRRAQNLSIYQGESYNFARVWALELAADGVRVNAIAPGAIRNLTQRTKDAHGRL